MSIYASLVCVDCKVQLWLGKAIFQHDSTEQPTYFQRGNTDNGVPLNSENLVLSKALWKMLADHARHSLKVIVEGDPDYPATGDYAEIGGDEFKDIAFEKYLEGWPG